MRVILEIAGVVKPHRIFLSHPPGIPQKSLVFLPVGLDDKLGAGSGSERLFSDSVGKAVELSSERMFSDSEGKAVELSSERVTLASESCV